MIVSMVVIVLVNLIIIILNFLNVFALSVRVLLN